jgi:HSF-type DNA-binding
MCIGNSQSDAMISDYSNHCRAKAVITITDEAPLAAISDATYSTESVGRHTNSKFGRFRILRRKPTNLVIASSDGKCTSHRHSRIVVQHDYHDHCEDAAYNAYPGLLNELKHSHSGGVAMPFPIKLHEMLQSIENDGVDDIVSWQPHGRCFVVHKSAHFKKEILPHYFNLNKIASFQRQLNLYGFKRLTKGPDKGGYYHELFLRGRPDLAQAMHRVKVKGTGVRAKSNPEAEPDFWTNVPWITSSDEVNTHSHGQNSLESLENGRSFNCGFSTAQMGNKVNESAQKPLRNEEFDELSFYRDEHGLIQNKMKERNKIDPMSVGWNNSFYQIGNEKYEDNFENSLSDKVYSNGYYEMPTSDVTFSHQPYMVESDESRIDDFDLDCLMDSILGEDDDLIEILEGI